MSYLDSLDEEEFEHIMYEIQSYADMHPEFDTKFVDSIQKIIDKSGEISIKQAEVIRDIHRKVLKMKEYQD